MDLEKLRSSGIEPYIMIDTYDFMQYCIKKYGYTNNSWNKEIWRKLMVDGFISESYKCYIFKDNPENILEEHINDFLIDFPEFKNRVYFIFTN